MAIIKMTVVVFNLIIKDAGSFSEENRFAGSL